MIKLIFSLSSLSFIGYSIGFVNQIIIANKFGTSTELDIYLLAFSVVNFGWFFIGPINEISIPNLFQQTKKSKESGSIYFSKILNIILLFSVIMSIVIYLFLPDIYIYISSDKNINYSEFKENILLLMPIIFLTAITQYFQVVLNSMSKYIAQSIGKIVTASISVCFLLLYFDNFGIKAIIYGLEIGLIILTILQFYFIYKLNISYKPVGGIITEKTYYKHVLALSFTYFLSSLQVIYERFVFISFGDGVLSSYNYSQALLQVPQMIVVTGIVTIVWTNFMKKIHDNDINEGIDELFSIALNAFIIALYISITISIFSKEIVFVIFKSGEFNTKSLEMTSQILQISIFLLPLMIFINIIGRSFTALKEIRIMLRINFLMFILLMIALYAGYLFSSIKLILIFQIIVYLFILFISIFFLKQLYEESNMMKVNFSKLIFTIFLLCLIFLFFQYFQDLYNEIESKIYLILLIAICMIIAIFTSLFNIKYIQGNSK